MAILTMLKEGSRCIAKASNIRIPKLFNRAPEHPRQRNDDSCTDPKRMMHCMFSIDPIQEFLQSLPETGEAWTEEEARMSTPYSDLATWRPGGEF